jgi:hypothetical protein
MAIDQLLKPAYGELEHLQFSMIASHAMDCSLKPDG